MKISVIIPIYNMANSLAKCIDSIKGQTYHDYEIVLVDDGSTDNSYEICTQYASKYDNVVAYHQENQGSGPARNTGIAHATGDYLLFIDSDDVIEKDAFRILADRIQETQSDLYVFGYKLIDISGNDRDVLFEARDLLGEDIRKDYSPYMNPLFRWGIQGAPWNKLFKAKVVKENNIEYPALRRHQDEVFIARYVAHTKNVRFIEDCLYIHYSNDIKLVWRKFPKNYFDVLEQLYAYKKEVIIPWNPDNKKVEALIYSEYINNVFRACFRLFDIDNRQNYLKRAEWYKQNVFARVEIKEYDFPKELLGRTKVLQNNLFIFAIKNKLTCLLDLLIRIRINFYIHG